MIPPTISMGGFTVDLSPTRVAPYVNPHISPERQKIAMITPDLITPPAIVAYTKKHWAGYSPACYVKHSESLHIKLPSGASYTVYGIFSPETIGHDSSLTGTLAHSEDNGMTTIETPDKPHAHGLVCLAIQND